MKRFLGILWVVFLNLGLPSLAGVGITLGWLWLTLVVFRLCVDFIDYILELGVV